MKSPFVMKQPIFKHSVEQRDDSGKRCVVCPIRHVHLTNSLLYELCNTSGNERWRSSGVMMSYCFPLPLPFLCSTSPLQDAGFFGGVF